MIGTSLAPVIGYDLAAQIAKEASKSDRTIREVARDLHRPLRRRPLPHPRPQDHGRTPRLESLQKRKRRHNAPTLSLPYPPFPKYRESEFTESRRWCGAAHPEPRRRVERGGGPNYRFVAFALPPIKTLYTVIPEKSGSRSTAYPGLNIQVANSETGSLTAIPHLVPSPRTPPPRPPA